MNYQIHKLEKLAGFVEQYTPQEGINFTTVKSLGTYRASTTQGRAPEIDIPAIVIVVQGKKACYMGDQTHIYEAGKVLVGFYPIPVETEIVEATPEEPYLAVGVALDMSRMADLLLRIDRVDETAPGGTPAPSARARGPRTPRSSRGWSASSPTLRSPSSRLPGVALTVRQRS